MFLLRHAGAAGAVHGKQLLLPGHVEHVMGFGLFRRAIEHFYGPLTPLAPGSTIFGLYAGFVYVTPIAGGILADRFLGRTRTMVIGALLMTAGHFLMAFEVSFLPAPCLLAILSTVCSGTKLATSHG